jgi:hypothetical protein
VVRQAPAVRLRLVGLSVIFHTASPEFLTLADRLRRLSQEPTSRPAGTSPPSPPPSSCTIRRLSIQWCAARASTPCWS